MTPILRFVPNLCFAVATILFVGQAYFLARSMMRGYGYDYAVDLSRDMTLQLVAIWLKVFANAAVWVAFGLLAKLLIRAIDDLAAARAVIAAQPIEVTDNA